MKRTRVEGGGRLAGWLASGLRLTRIRRCMRARPSARSPARSLAAG